MARTDRTPLVLLVECDAVIGLDLSEALTLAGYRVAGPATTLRGAGIILSRTRPDIAVLEAVLEDGTCTAIARTLRRDGVPFVIHSHSTRDECASDDLRDAPWLLKPSLPGEVISTLSQLSGTHPRPGLEKA